MAVIPKSMIHVTSTGYIIDILLIDMNYSFVKTQIKKKNKTKQNSFIIVPSSGWVKKHSKSPWLFKRWQGCITKGLL